MRITDEGIAVEAKSKPQIRHLRYKGVDDLDLIETAHNLSMNGDSVHIHFGKIDHISRMDEFPFGIHLKDAFKQSGSSMIPTQALVNAVIEYFDESNVTIVWTQTEVEAAIFQT
jgi:hypothetical protein